MINVKGQVFLSPIRVNKRLRWATTYCRGQTLVEYALIIAVVSIVAISVLINLGSSVRSIYTMVNTQLIVSAASSH